MLCYRCGHYAPDGSAKCPGCGNALPATGAGNGLGVDLSKRKASTTRGPQAIFSVGETVAERYKIIDVIGQGGVGTVYRAHDTDIDVDVALKAIAPKLLQTPEEQKIFSKFIKAARKLHHANIVRIYDEGRDATAQFERRFYTMQLLEGLTLRKIIALRREKTQVFQLAEVEPIFSQLAAALDYAHRTQWHGSLKPENVVVLPDLLKITDFCLIQALPTKPFLAIQKARGAAFHYIAPEVRLEASRIDGRADVYSLGVILAEMVTGELYDTHDPKPFQRALERLPRGLEQLIRKAVNETADGRVASAGEFAEQLSDLAAAAEEAPDGELPPLSPPTPPPDSDVHHLGQLNSTSESIPELSGSSILLIEPPKEATDVTRVPTEVAHTPDLSRLEKSDETPVDHLKDAHRPRTTHPPQSARERDPSGEHNDIDTLTEGKPLLRERPRPNEPTVVKPEQDLDNDTSPGKKRPKELSSGNGHSKDPFGPPPPVPANLDSSQEDSVPPIPGPAVDLGNKLTEPNIHDALTALRIQARRPGERRPTGESTPAQRRPAAEPPSVGPAIAISRDPIPVTDQPTQSGDGRKSRTRFFALAGSAGLAVGAGLFFLVRMLVAPSPATPGTEPAPPQAPVTTASSAAPAGKDDWRAVINQDKGSAPAPPQASPAPSAEQIKKDDEARKQEEQRRLEEQKKQEEQKKVDDQRKLEAQKADEERRAEEKRRADEERQRKINDATDRAAKMAAQREADEAAKREKADELKRRKDEEAAARAAEAEAKKQAALEAKKRKDEEAAAAAKAREQAALEAKKRKDEEAAAAAKAQASQTVAQAPTGTTCPKGMAFIDSGPFKMGSSGDDPMHNFEEKRLEVVDVAAYCIDYYEFPNSKAAKPTTNVSWFQAQEQCKAKNKRLCTEEEWEKACKGPNMLRYPYGNTWESDTCNTQDADGNDRELTEQQAFPKCRSGYKIINLSGNASEWTSSTFSATVKDRVHKGGAANRPDWATRCANRANLAPSAKQPFLGFRCCATPTSGSEGGE